MGLTAKRFAPSVSLGTLVLASMLADLLWCVFMIFGIEHVQFKPALGAANYFAATDIAISHSLLTDTLWASLLAAAYLWTRGNPRAAWIIFAAVLSHWLLDWVSHEPDMPLSPGSHRFFGLGMWRSVPLSIAVEGGFWLLAAIAYVRATRTKTRTSGYAFWIVFVLLTLTWFNNLTGPPPSDPEFAPYASLILFALTIVWAYWMNRIRPLKAAVNEPS